MPKLNLALFLLCLVFQGVVADELTNEKYRDIKRLIEITGASNLAEQMASVASQQFLQMLKASNPEIPDRALIVMETELKVLYAEKIPAPGGLLDQTIPIYDKYLSHEEIRELLAFYETPVGQKAILVMPSVVRDSTMAGQRWGQSLGPEIQERIVSALRREGLLEEAP